MSRPEARECVRRMFAAAALVGVMGAGPADACRLALVLALDVSGSVDAREYRLQLDGLAAALRDEDVLSAIVALPEEPVQLAIFEWSGAAFQRQILEWTALPDEASVDAVAARLEVWQRMPAPEATGLGAAMQAAAGQIGDGPDCWRSVLDVSGDGKNNDWPDPEAVRPALAGVTVNALAVAPEAALPDLAGYFRAEVIHGRDAFVETARGYDDYARAIKRKLLREIATPAVGRAPAPGRPGPGRARRPGRRTPHGGPRPRGDGSPRGGSVSVRASERNGRRTGRTGAPAGS